MDDPTEAQDGGDPRAGVDHLQAAGREFVAAARSFLDAVESVVEDRSRLGELAESFTGFVGELIDTARGGDRTPWGQAVRFDPTDDGSGSATGRDEAPVSGPVDPPTDRPTAPPTEGRPDREPPRTGRVRRIPVD